MSETFPDLPEGGKRGDFFAVDRRAWAETCRLGLNPGVAYLVLARFSGRDQRTTKAGANAVETHTGIARARAKAAIRALEQAGLVTEADGITRRIVPAHELPGVWRRPAHRPLAGKQRVVYDKVRRGEELTGAERQRVYPLIAGGWLAKGRDGTLRPTDEDAASETRPDWIWLPNALVTGAAGEVPPLELVRQGGDPVALRVLADLYHAQNLTSDGGIHWRQIRGGFRRVKVGEQGPFVVWGFSPELTQAWSTAPFIEPHMTGEPDEGGRDQGWKRFWSAWTTLQSLGLVEEVGHLIEADTADAEIIHPYAVGNGEPIERELAKAAHEAGLGMVTSGQYDWASSELGKHPWLAPVRRHIANVAMVGVARLRYRPRTAATAAWFSRRDNLGARWSSAMKRCRPKSTADGPRPEPPDACNIKGRSRLVQRGIKGSSTDVLTRGSAPFGSGRLRRRHAFLDRRPER